MGKDPGKERRRDVKNEWLEMRCLRSLVGVARTDVTGPNRKIPKISTENSTLLPEKNNDLYIHIDDHINIDRSMTI